jgi:hypothetical protein
MMKSLTTIVAASAVVVSAGAVSSFNVELDGMPMNNLLHDNGGKPSSEQHHAHKSRRMAERRARVIAAIATNADPQVVGVAHESGHKNGKNNVNEKVHRSGFMSRMSEDELEQAYAAAEATSKMRGLKIDEFNNGGEFLRRAKQELKANEVYSRNLWGNGANTDPYDSTAGLVDETKYYDKWQQAYRFLGPYIDCTHSWSKGGGHSNDEKNEQQDQNAEQGCSRWMIWASYIDPNYAGGGYSEYFGNEPPGTLDCHSPDTTWKLVGVYKQEFYQYVEQISKHLWAVNEYEYIVALAGLKYMTKNQCYAIGKDESGNVLYSEVQPLAGGKWQMGLYSDAQCISLNTQTGYTYDDFAAQSDLYLGSKDKTDDDAFHTQAYTYWQETQEYTLTNLNNVYEDYKFCTSCVDYPTYQDGYFIGDDGKDDDDLINQCWKFYSHSSYNCDSDCLAMASQQGTITWVAYNGKQFGTMIEGQYEHSHGKTSSESAMAASTAAAGTHRIDRLKANLFLTFAGIVFVATFITFAVARGSNKKAKTSRRDRSRRLLDADYADGENGRRSMSSRSQSRPRKSSSDAKSVRSSRSKSRSGRPSSGKSVSGKSVKTTSRSKSRDGRSEYKPPSSSDDEKREKRRDSRSKSRVRTPASGERSSRRHEEKD